jgi:hypothetical protein
MNNTAMNPAAGDCTLGPLGRLSPRRARARSFMMWAAGLTPVVPSRGEDRPWRAAQERVLVQAVKARLD